MSDKQQAVRHAKEAGARLVVPIIKPKAYLPVHWDGLYAAFGGGMPRAYSDRALEQFLTGAGVNLLKPDNIWISGGWIETASNRWRTPPSRACLASRTFSHFQDERIGIRGYCSGP